MLAQMQWRQIRRHMQEPINTPVGCQEGKATGWKQDYDRLASRAYM